jgi:hypothetical protein
VLNAQVSFASEQLDYNISTVISQAEIGGDCCRRVQTVESGEEADDAG